MKNLLYAVLLALCGSCTYSFEIDDFASTPKLVLYSFPGNRDTTLIQVSRSMPVSAESIAETGLPSADICFYVNGEAKEVRRADGNSTSLPEGSYYVTGNFVPGDRVRITAEAPGLPPVVSETEIPNPVSIKNIRIVAKQNADGSGNNGKETQFQITFQDDGSETNYYGLKVERMDSSFSQYDTFPPDYSCRVSEVFLYLDDEPLLHQAGALNDFFFDNYEEAYRGSFCVFPDDKINGREYTLHLNTQYQWNYESAPGASHKYYHYIYYRITLFSLSRDYFLFVRQLIDQDNNELGNYGLSPIRHTYTNVHDGLGVTGGYVAYQSGWLDNVE